METIECSNVEVSIVWKPEVSVHDSISVKTLPYVDDPNQTPLIRMKNTTNEQFFDKIAKCPSGALGIKTITESNNA